MIPCGEMVSYPLPLWERVASRYAKPGEGSLSASSSAERTPHPALRATFSHKGRRNIHAARSARKALVDHDGCGCAAGAEPAERRGATAIVGEADAVRASR